MNGHKMEEKGFWWKKALWVALTPALPTRLLVRGVGVRRFSSMPRLSWWNTAHGNGYFGVQANHKGKVPGQVMLYSGSGGGTTGASFVCIWVFDWRPFPPLFLLPRLQPPTPRPCLQCLAMRKRVKMVFFLHDYDTSERLSCGIFFSFHFSLGNHLHMLIALSYKTSSLHWESIPHYI